MIAEASAQEASSRAASWFVGRPDPTMRELLDRGLAPRTNTLADLRRVARAADELDAFLTNQSAPGALALLRTLVANSEPRDLAERKSEVVTALAREIGTQPLSFMQSVRNLDLANLPGATALERAIQQGVARGLPHASPDEASALFMTLAPRQGLPWWRAVVDGVLREQLATPDNTWASAALTWLGTTEGSVVLRDALPSTPQVEQRLLVVADGVTLPPGAIERLLGEARQRGWSRLHAWAAMHALSPGDALKAQRAFPSEPQAGLALLVERLPGRPLVTEAVALEDESLFALVARRTFREPTLLRGMDVNLRAWRRLWVAHIRSDGALWPPECDQEELARRVLDSVLAGDPQDELIIALASSIAKVTLHHEGRAHLWRALRAGGRSDLLRAVASELARACERGEPIATPEVDLFEAVLALWRETPPSALGLAKVLAWERPLDEYTVKRWVERLRPDDLVLVAQALGEAARRRDWKRLADYLYDQWRKDRRLLSAVEACQELLSWWRRQVVSTSASRSLDETTLARRLGELGADLAPFQLAVIWVDAGGDRKDLDLTGTPHDQWHHAVDKARKGKLGGGMYALYRELKQSYEYNLDLRELGEHFKHMPSRY